MNSKTESAMLLDLVPELEAEGYDVYLQPNRPIAPAFLGSFKPDAVALRDDKNLVIEVAQRGGPAEERLKEVAGLFEGHDDWNLRIYWVTQSSPTRTVSVVSTESIQSRLLEMGKLLDGGYTGPALLLGWAIFEAIGRAALSDQFERPQTPGRLVEVLASRGLITPTEADRIRELVPKRNALIHGGLTTIIGADEVNQFRKALEGISASLA